MILPTFLIQMRHKIDDNQNVLVCTLVKKRVCLSKKEGQLRYQICFANRLKRKSTGMEKQNKVLKYYASIGCQKY